MSISENLTEPAPPCLVPIRYVGYLSYDEADKNETSGFEFPIALAHWHLGCLQPKDYAILGYRHINPQRDRILEVSHATWDPEHITLFIETHRVVDISKLSLNGRAIFLAWASSESFESVISEVLQETGIDVSGMNNNGTVSVRNKDYKLCQKLLN